MDNMNADVISGQSVSSISNENDSNNLNLATLIQQNAGLQMPYQMMLLPSNITQSLLLQQHLQQLTCNNGVNNLLTNLISLNNINSTLGQQQNIEYVDPTLIAQQMLLNNQANILNTNLITSVQNSLDSNQSAKTDTIEVININGNNDSIINNINTIGNSVITNDKLCITSDSNKLLNQPLVTDKSKQPSSRPPKKPLTPYMIFSKQVWPKVKDANKHLSSVCEIGAIVGRMWRDLGATDKQIYNELYFKEKERYDRELQEFFKETGMTPSDLIKPRVKRSSTGVKLYSVQSHGQTISQITAQINQSSSQSFDPNLTTTSATSTNTPITITPLVITPQAATIPFNETSLTSMPLNTLQNELSQVPSSTTSAQQQATTDMTATTSQTTTTTLTEQDLFEQLGLNASTILQNGEYVYSIDANTLANIIALQQQQQQQNIEVASSEVNIDNSNNEDTPNINNNNNINVINQIPTNDQINLTKLESELQEMRVLVLEKCQEVDELTSKLNQAYALIEQLKSIDQSTIFSQCSAMPLNNSSNVSDQIKISIEQSDVKVQPSLSIYSSNAISAVDSDFVHKFVVSNIADGNGNVSNNNISSNNNNNNIISINIKRDSNNDNDTYSSNLVIGEAKLFNNIHNEDDHNYVTKIFHDNVDAVLKKHRLSNDEEDTSHFKVENLNFNSNYGDNDLVVATSSIHGTCRDVM